MSIDMYLSESRSQANGAKTMCQQQSSSYELLQNAVTKFTSTGGQLAGDAYDSARSFFSSVIRPLAQGGNMLSEAVGEACQKFPDDYVAQVCEESLKESELREKIARIERQMDSLRELQETIDSSVLPSTFKAALRVSNTLMMNCYQDACSELKLKLFKLEAFNATSPGIFSEISALRSLVEQGLAQADSSWNAKTGRFDVPAQMPWAEGITERLNNKAFEKKYGLERPKEMPEKEYQEYITALRAQEDVLKKEDGWDESAFGAYIGHIKEDLEKGYINEDGEKALERLKTINENTRKVGSDVYTKMFEAYGLVDGKIPNGKEQEVHHKRLELLMKQMGGEIDEHGMLQLKGSKHKFDPNMAPHAEFLDNLAKTVQKAYPKGLLDGYEDMNGSEQDFVKSIHQFRMYIDKHNIEYIREKFKGEGMSDEEALADYVHKTVDEGGLGGEKMIAERGRLHNKYLKGTSYSKENDEVNRKRLTPDFHSEFILDPNGKFVTQWDVLEEKDGVVISDPNHYSAKYSQSKGPQQFDYEEVIMNTESYNYADKNGQVHKDLDSRPPEILDYELRKEIGKRWTSPINDEEYVWNEVDIENDEYSIKD